MNNKSYKNMSKQELLDEICLLVSFSGLAEPDQDLLLEAILEFKKK